MSSVATLEDNNAEEIDCQSSESSPGPSSDQCSLVAQSEGGSSSTVTPIGKVLVPERQIWLEVETSCLLGPFERAVSTSELGSQI